ncbi:MAG: SHOCT domain-containing protein [Lachnospiraceae bacterium]|nr:SHOCT domain-containing protein [Lachnospiraceae bacterium]
MAKKIKVRPGKTQSKAGFIVGIMFCLIGVFAVVPMFGPFGLVWTGIAAWITYSNYRNGFTDKPISNQVIEIEDDGNSITVMPDIMGHSREVRVVNPESVEDRLKKLQGLYQQELITKEEYEKKKQEILDEI